MRTAKQILEESRTIAVVGCSNAPWRDSYRIASFLRSAGYRIYPVNPTIDSALGMQAYPDVRNIPEQVDIVNVFRNPRHVPEVVEDAIAAGARTIWLQLGVVNPAAERRALDAGLEVISDRCIAVDFRRLGVRRSE